MEHPTRTERNMAMNELDQIEARILAASPGPWAVMNVNDPGEDVNFIDVYAESDGLETVCRMPNPADYSMREFLEADAEFIAHSPDDAAYLLTLARKQAAALEAVNVWVGRHKTGFYDEAQDDVFALIRDALGAGE